MPGMPQPKTGVNARKRVNLAFLLFWIKGDGAPSDLADEEIENFNTDKFLCIIC